MNPISCALGRVRPENLTEGRGRVAAAAGRGGQRGKMIFYENARPLQEGEEGGVQKSRQKVQGAGSDLRLRLRRAELTALVS